MARDTIYDNAEQHDSDGDNGDDVAVTLRATNYLTRSASSSASPWWKPIWIINRRCTNRLCLMSTVVSLWILHAALQSINTLGLSSPSEYKLVRPSTTACDINDCNYENLKQSHLITTTHYVWYYCAYVVLGCMLLLDILHYFNISSIISVTALGIHSPNVEKWRKSAFILLLIPFIHLSHTFLYKQEILIGECCRWALTTGWSHVYSFFFLLFVTGYFLLGDAHHHGYFLFRIQDRNSIEILRTELLLSYHQSRYNTRRP